MMIPAVRINTIVKTGICNDGVEEVGEGEKGELSGETVGEAVGGLSGPAAVALGRIVNVKVVVSTEYDTVTLSRSLA